MREQNHTGRSLTRSIRENAQDAPCSSVGGSTFWYSVACASAHSSRERCGHAACVAFRVAFTLLLDCDGARLPLRRRTRQTLQHVNADVSLEVLAERRVVLNETRISIAGASAKRRTVRALHALEVLVAWQRRRRVTTLMRNVPHGSEVAVCVHSVANTSRRGQIDADERRLTLLQGGVAVIQPTASGSLGAVS